MDEAPRARARASSSRGLGAHEVRDHGAAGAGALLAVDEAAAAAAAQRRADERRRELEVAAQVGLGVSSTGARQYAARRARSNACGSRRRVEHVRHAARAQRARFHALAALPVERGASGRGRRLGLDEHLPRPESGMRSAPAIERTNSASRAAPRRGRRSPTLVQPCMRISRRRR